MKIKELFAGTTIDYPLGLEEIVTSVQTDSKKVHKGSLFCAVEGNVRDGKQFISEAIEKGATAILCEKPIAVPNGVHLFISENMREDIALIAKNLYQESDEKLDIYAVTGTNGKTSTVMALNDIMHHAGKKNGYITTVEKSFGSNSHPSSLTTPDPFELHSNFFEMVKEGCETCGIEASSHGIHQKRLSGITFKCRILTNITSDHLDYHKTVEAYRQVKKEFLCDGNDLTVLNINDPVTEEVLAAKKNCVTYGINNRNADLYAENVRYDENGLSFDMQYKGEKRSVFAANLIGDYMAENLIAAALAALSSGIELDVIVRAIENFIPPRGRLSKIMGIEDFDIFVDFAHTPDALEKTIKTLRPLVKNKLRVVFGCGGNRDKTKRPRMGKIADLLSDKIYLTSDNSRWEDTKDILKEIMAGIKRKKNIYSCEDRAEAISKAVVDAKAGDIILIAGKGHEPYQEFRGVKHLFSDFDTAKNAIAKRRKGKK